MLRVIVSLPQAGAIGAVARWSLEATIGSHDSVREICARELVQQDDEAAVILRDVLRINPA